MSDERNGRRKIQQCYNSFIRVLITMHVTEIRKTKKIFETLSTNQQYKKE